MGSATFGAALVATASVALGILVGVMAVRAFRHRAHVPAAPADGPER